MKRAAALIALAMASIGARATDCDVLNSFDSRDHGDPALAKLGLAAVTGKDAAHFSTCPGANCIGKPYLLAGDTVVTAQTVSRWTCALFPNKLGGTTGWLPANRLAALPVDRNPQLSAWSGKWRRDTDAAMDIRVTGGKLTIAGEAFWRGSPVNVHTGELEGTNRPSGNLLDLPPPAERRKDFDPSLDCIAELRLVGPYLLVEDNMHCGGMNVTFTGAYRRPAAK